MKQLKHILGDPEDDRGAALLMALIIVFTISVVGLSLLSFSSVSIKYTDALRTQGARAYAADGAARAAIQELKTPVAFPCSGSPLNLGGATAFYTAPTGTTALNASVSCIQDTTSGLVIGQGNKPLNATALFTSGEQKYSGFDRLLVKVDNGNVISNSAITTEGKGLQVTEGFTVQVPKGDCAGNKFLPTGVCRDSAGSLPAPAYPAPTPTGRVPAAPKPECTTGKGTTYAAFQPGLYTDLTDLNGPCSEADVVWFSPGIYYFNFDGRWDVPQNGLVGGTPVDSTGNPIKGLDPTNVSTLSNLSQLKTTSPACADPSQLIAPGVEFVFGGKSQINFGKKNGPLEICAAYSGKDVVPIAIYVPTTDIRDSDGKVLVNAQTSPCLKAECLLFQNPDDSNGKLEFYVQGFVYAPNARISLKLKNSHPVQFNWGLELSSLELDAGSSFKVPTGIVKLPVDGDLTTSDPSTMYLNVYVCAAPATCSTTAGTPTLRAKVHITGSTVQVLSWAVQR